MVDLYLSLDQVTKNSYSLITEKSVLFLKNTYKQYTRRTQESSILGLHGPVGGVEE
ncbi:hypothetical protein NCCP2331_10540 [Sporosarcina sp. NCCP-2331]|nr:hypothetical protein NCCP2331_10540 [Sporosarcina sp. NCCP-2331]GLB55011.1 hypothetical protein NCCP2378_07960 [Sporosarcina sp. NCCP-2378]